LQGFDDPTAWSKREARFWVIVWHDDPARFHIRYSLNLRVAIVLVFALF